MKVVRKHGGEVADATVETLSLDQPSIVHLRIAPENVSRFERRGADLALVLQDGSVTVLRGFFSVYPDNGRNDLVLEDESGVMWWGQYTSPWTQFHFTEIEWLDAVPALPVTDGLPGWLIAGLAVLGLGAAAGGGGGGGGGSAPPPAPVNNSPSANANSLEVRVGSTGQGRVDARDPDGDAVTFSVSKVPANGEVVIDPRTGEFVYTARPGYVGTDSFEVTVDDGKGGTATISVPVTVTNDDPVASAPPVTTPEDEPVSGKVTAEDADGDTVSFAVGTPPSHGTLTLDPATGDYTYTPDPDYHGGDSFTVTVNDGNGGSTTVTVPITVTPVADGFADADEVVSVPEDGGAISGSLLTGSSSVDGPLTVTGFSLAGLTGPFTLGTAYTVPGQGTITVNADGTYSFVAVPDWNGDFPVISYSITDGTSTDTSTLTLTVTPVNDAPVPSDPNEGLDPGDPGYVPGQTFDPATGDYGHTTAEDKPVSGRVTGSDADGDALSYTKGNDPANGTVVVNEDGSYTYTPNSNFNGTDEFTVVVDDGKGGTSTSTVTVTVTPVNDAPVPSDPNEGLDPGDPGYVPGQSFDPATGDYGHTTAEDEPVSGRVTGSDADGDVLSYTKGNDPTNGTVVVNEDGTYTYTPNSNFNGTDEFTVVVDDGKGGTTTSTVTVSVTPVNDAPLASNDGPISVTEDTPATGNVLSNDSDPDAGTTLVVTQFTVGTSSYDAGQTATIAGVGTLVINGNGAFTFTPAPNYTGAVPSATYTVSDGALTDTAVLSFGNVTPVNDAPVPSDPNEGLDPGDPGYVPGQSFDPATGDYGHTTAEDEPVSGRVTGSDADGDALSYTKGNDPANGTVVVNEDGTYTYTPNSNFNGTDEFTVVVDDGKGGTTTSTVTVSVTPVNDAPLASNDGPISVTEDTPATGNVLSNDSDPDTGTTLVVTQFTVGTSSYEAGQIATIAGVGTLVINGNGAFTFTPAPNYTGAVPSATYTVSDGALTDTAVLSFANVTPVNDAPVPSDPNEGLNPGDPGYVPGQSFDPATGDYGHTTAEDEPVSGRVTGSDADGDVLSYTKGNDPTNGTVVVNEDGSYTYTPNSNFNGTDEFTVVVDDGKGGTSTSTVTVTVTPVNDAPVPSDPNEGLEPGDPGYVPGQSFDPATGDYGHTTAEDEPVSGRVTGSDADGDALSYTKGNDPTNGTVVVNEDGTYTYTPNPNFNGTDEFTVVVDDGKGGTTTSTVTVSVTPVNDAPLASNDGPISVTEDTPATGNVLSNDSDPDAGTTLVVTQFTVGTSSYDAGQTATIAGVGTLVINGNGAFTFTPAPNYTGAVPSATYTVSDGTLTDTAVLSFGNVTPVNDAPVVVADSNTTLEETPLTVTAANGVLANDGDVENGAITVTQFTVEGVVGTFLAGETASITNVGALTINADGGYTFIPVPNYSGPVPVATYTVSDGVSASSSTLTLAVTPVTDAPVIAAQADFSISGTQLTTYAWNGISQVNAGGTVYNLTENAGDGASAATLKGAIDYLVANRLNEATQGTTTSLQSTSLPTLQAKLITGFMYLEAGQTYKFSGSVDDSGMLVIGDAAQAHVNWQGTSTGVDSQFTVEKSGFYTFDLYLHNASGVGNYNFNVVNVDGSAVQLFGNTTDITNALADGYMALGDFQDGDDADGKGFHELVFGYGHTTGQGAGDPISLTGVQASVTDQDGSETLSMTLTGLPDGTTLTYTNVFADGTSTQGSATVQGGTVVVDGQANVVSFENLQVDVPDGLGGMHQVTLTVTAKDGAAEAKTSVLEFQVNAGLNEVARMSGQAEDPSRAEDAAQHADHPQSNAADSAEFDAMQLQPRTFFAESLGLANLDADAFQADEPQAHKPVLSELLMAPQGESSLDTLLSFLPPGSTVTGASGGVGHPAGESVAYSPPVVNPLDDDLHHANLVVA
ncbi:tandem-95 repeat protein [Variovorax sp. LT1R16]|uniref:tandem-95 repeat protein n=1 Tax=Variovorax sp. LT1R16 TaxID=3443728 RepID=UPI003F44651A